MAEYKAKAFLKLGTALRYLIDVREGEPISGSCILDNIDAVLSLTDELGFCGTKDHARFAELKKMREALSEASKTRPKITAEEAEKLEKICRRYRDCLFGEGDRIKLFSEDYIESAKEAKPSETGWKATLFKSIRITDILALGSVLLALVSGAFFAGIKLADNPVIIDLFDLEPAATSETPISQEAVEPPTETDAP